ncbi:nucleotidyltransferase domain-containing protein, partial [candidate division WOR-3 bacterium]|nr:nucleotidyltransferase domain-containing protein [candidate division WOR-3 bacterium]
MNKIKKILYSTNSQKILDFLLSHPDEEFFDRQISKLADVSRSGTNFALRDLAKANIIKREKRGRMCFYSIDNHDFIIKQLKILQSATLLYPLVNKLKSYSLRIVLYGSAAKGENSVDSDIDLFIQSREAKKVKNIIYRNPLREKIQYVVYTPLELAKLKKE